MNRLSTESSPYLLQHAHNPVDWMPWGEEALDLARKEDKPIFLSIGYSACHWCHVMERESFTDPETAALLNEHFISIKVDREERPDLDTIYLQAVAAIAGQGGWPLSVWLDPQGVPFYGGTYFPPSPSYGRPSFRQVLIAIIDMWKNRRDELRSAGAQIRTHLAQEDTGGQPTPHGQTLELATAELVASFDSAQGGWGGAPKFPQPLVVDYLLSRWAVDARPELGTMITTTLDKMARGGIRDHVGGGFHRYSTDERWLVPHFEKMLYDNAQLARCYLHAWQVTEASRYKEVAAETLGYLLDRLRHPEGGFFSAEDADSEGSEGTFYLWTPAQLDAVLDEEETKLLANTYGVVAEGHFEGANILHLVTDPGPDDTVSASAPAGPENEALRAALSKLRSARDRRPRPARDEKVIASWNGLALATLAEAARALASERYLEAATTTGRFVLDRLLPTGGRLAHSWTDGKASHHGFLEDYACVAEGLLALYQASFDELWFTSARALVDTMAERFRRPSGGFYDTSDDHETLIVRPRSLQDSPTPSGNSLAAGVLLKMSAYTGESSYRELAEETIGSLPAYASRAPTMFAQWLSVLHLMDTGMVEVAVVGDPAAPQTKRLQSVLGSAFRPTVVTAARTPASVSAVPLLLDREPEPGMKAAAWVCRENACAAPTADPDELLNLLEP